MPGPTPLTTPNNSSIAVRTSTQRCNKGPIDNNGTPQIHPQNCPFPFDDHHQNLIHPYQARPHSPPQTASRSNQLFCRSSLLRTDRWNMRMFCNISAPLAMLIESDMLIMIVCLHHRCYAVGSRAARCGCSNPWYILSPKNII